MWLTALAVTLLSFVPAWSSSGRYFLDCSATSPAGLWRIDAKSPNNNPKSQPYASNFTYTLTDLRTNQVVWTRRQPMTRAKADPRPRPAEASPQSVYVNDDGLVVIYTGDDTFVVLDPASGRKRGEPSFFIPPASRTNSRGMRRVDYPGNFLAPGGDLFFRQLPAAGADPARDLFVVRTRWARWRVLDLQALAPIPLAPWDHATDLEKLPAAPAETRRLVEAIVAEERRRATAVFRGAGALLARRRADDGSHQSRMDYLSVHAAARVAILHKCADLEPELRALERTPAIAGTWLNHAVRQTLRAGGHVPAPGFGVELPPPGGTVPSPRRWLDRGVVPVQQRVANASSVTSGLTTEQLVDLMGFPDSDLSDHDFDYDIDAPDAYTLRVRLDSKLTTVVAVRVIRPFAFLHEANREELSW